MRMGACLVASMEALLGGWGTVIGCSRCEGRVWLRAGGAGYDEYSPGWKPQGVVTKPRRELTGPNMAGSTAEDLRSGGRMDSGGR